MSVLRPETLAELAAVRERAPLFPNLIQAELFEAAHTRGPFKVLRTTTGGFVVFDTRAPLAHGVRDHQTTVAEAHASLERIAAEDAG